MNDKIFLDKANEIYKDFKNKTKKDLNFSKISPDDQLDYFQKKYKHFSLTFPIVLRYMVQLKWYSTKAFTQFLKKLKTNPYRSEDEYCKRQADYVKYLYMDINKHMGMHKANEVWQSTYNKLQLEVEMFKKMSEEVKQKNKKNEIKNREERREELKKLLDNMKNIELRDSQE